MLKKLKNSFLGRSLKKSREIFLLFKANISLLKVFLYDYKKFRRNYSHVYSKKKISGIRSWLLFDIHRLEKGLVLKKTRLDFGIDSINRILNNLTEYQTSLNLEDCELNSEKLASYAISILIRYDSYHQSKGCTHTFSNDEVFHKFTNLQSNQAAGTKTIEISDINFNDFESVVTTRFSCREFTGEPVDEEILNQAIKLAISTPSVCNRQHWRARHFKDTKCQEVLELQNGNAPFRDEIKEILVITTDLGYFITPFERYQQYIDGGMFSMSVLNALHHFKIGSCALNWAASLQQDIDIYKMKLIPNTESVVMVIAIGCYDKRVRAACSTRLEVDTIMCQR